MRARAVIGANFGDEGKGLVVDYLCATQGAGVVVRYNGGAQAGHTVVTPSGVRHVFHHIGAGTLAGVRTHLSRFFVCNPILFARELRELLVETNTAAIVTASAECMVTTFADMLANQRAEERMGDARHGSCGVGIFATLRRCAWVPLTMRHLWDDFSGVEARVVRACRFHFPHAARPTDDELAAFMADCRVLADMVVPGSLVQGDDPIFEGAQGLLLDQSRREYFPHLTPSSTGLQNVRELCAEAGFDGIDAYYVSRTYLTRHGAGRLPGESADMRYDDDTNVSHPFQGPLRFAPLDQYLKSRCMVDARSFAEPQIVLTHCDQRQPPTGMLAALYAAGPTREHVGRRPELRAA